MVVKYIDQYCACAYTDEFEEADLFPVDIAYIGPDSWPHAFNKSVTTLNVSNFGE